MNIKICIGTTCGNLTVLCPLGNATTFDVLFKNNELYSTMALIHLDLLIKVVAMRKSIGQWEDPTYMKW
jgi:hypothetical protein